MRYLFYYYINGWLAFNYFDEYGTTIYQQYMDYSFRAALQKFRQDFHLQYKNIILHSLY